MSRRAPAAPCRNPPYHRTSGLPVGPERAPPPEDPCPTASPSVPPSRTPTPRPGSRPPSRPPAARSSTSPIESTPTRSPRSKSTRPRPGSPRSCAITASPSSTRRAASRPLIRARSQRAGQVDPAPRIGILAEYDALPGLGHGCGHNTMAASGVGAAIALAVDRRRAAGRDRVPRHTRRGAGERQADHDRRRAVRGHRRGPAVPPVRPEPRREPTRSPPRTSTSCSPGSRPTPRPTRGGQERARCADPAVQLRRAVAPAAPPDGARPRHHPRGRHGGEHHPGPYLGLVHAAQRRPGVLRGHEDPVHRDVPRRPRWPPTRPSSVTYSGGATTMRNNQVLAERFRANMAAYGIEDMGDDPNAGSTDMANVSWVCPTIHPDLAICDEGVAGHSIAVPRRVGHAARRRDDAPRGDPRGPDRRRALPRSGPRRGRLGGVPGRLRVAAGVLPSAPARPAGRSISNRRRPERDGTRRGRTRDQRPSPEDHVAERPHDPTRPRSTRLRRPERLGRGLRDCTPTTTCRPTSGRSAS